MFKRTIALVSMGYTALSSGSAWSAGCADNLTLDSGPGALLACIVELSNTTTAAPAPLAKAIPAGAVLAFTTMRCPDGWEFLPSTQGRYLVGAHIGQEVQTETGVPLTSGENRAVGKHNHNVVNAGNHGHNLGAPGDHNHGYRSTDNGPLHDNRSNFIGGAGRFGKVADKTTAAGGNHNHSISEAGAHIHNVGNTGDIEGTNAPYLSVLMCVKE